MHVECYAQRLLNPFRGTVHTIRYASAEAVTLDGVHWDIYVANDDLLDGLDRAHRTQVSDIRYGNWSPGKGLKRGPLYPSDDFRRLEEMGAIVYEHLTRIHGRLPFPLKDHFEFWLLDTWRRPLALLSTALNDDELATDTTPAWRVGYSATEHFRSDVTDLPAADKAINAAEYLNRYINRRAGANPSAQWFRREHDGSGAGLHGINLPADLTGRTLERRHFPELVLADETNDHPHAHLLEEFRAWQAPWLLMLPGLSPALRRELEEKARLQALQVSRLYRLYPEVADPDLLKATLVEAILRRAQANPPATDADLPAFDLEPGDNPGPTD